MTTTRGALSRRHEQTKLLLGKLKFINFRDLQLAEHRWNGYTSYDNSTIVDIFVGLLKSTLTCSVCDHKSVTFDPFWDLSLPLPRSKSSGLNLLSCFAEFTQVCMVAPSPQHTRFITVSITSLS